MLIHCSSHQKILSRKPLGLNILVHAFARIGKRLIITNYTLRHLRSERIECAGYITFSLSLAYFYTNESQIGMSHSMITRSNKMPLVFFEIFGEWTIIFLN